MNGAACAAPFFYSMRDMNFFINNTIHIRHDNRPRVIENTVAPSIIIFPIQKEGRKVEKYE